MLKTIGVGFILISLGMFLFNKVESKRQKYLNFCEIKRAVTFLKHELSFSAPELFLICEKISNETSGEISEIFHNIHNKLKSNPTIDFGKAFKEAVKNRVLFSESVEKTVSDFARTLGKKSLDIEIENISKAQAALQMLEAEEKEKYLKDKKLIYTLGLASGAVVLILAI